MKSLDVLGPAKWPSLLLVLVFPVLAYTWGGWEDYWVGRDTALYGPTSVGDVAVLLTHPASADPLEADPVSWTVHLDRRRSHEVVAVDLAYGTASGPAGEWIPLLAQHAWEWSGELPPVTDATGTILHVWMRLRTGDRSASHGWAMGPSP